MHCRPTFATPAQHNHSARTIPCDANDHARPRKRSNQKTFLKLGSKLSLGTFQRIALAGLVAVATSAPALAADLLPPPPMAPVLVPVVDVGSGWYLRGDVGVGSQEIDKIDGLDVVKDGGSFWRKSLADTAFVGVGVGYQFNNFLRFDVTGEYRTSAKFDVSDKFVYNTTSYTIPGSSTTRRSTPSLMEFRMTASSS